MMILFSGALFVPVLLGVSLAMFGIRNETD